MSYRVVAPSLRITLTLVLLAVPPAKQATAKTTFTFRWLEEKTDTRLWRQIQASFAEELTPDDPRIVGSQAAMGHKFIYRVGTSDSSALVFIALQRDTSAQSQARFVAYNYDLATERKGEIPSPTKSDVWRLHIVQLAHFERTPVPDVVFEFWDCVACESQMLLASLRFDSDATEWRWRNWDKGNNPHTGWTLSVGKSAERGFDPEEQTQVDYVYQTSCVYRIGDLNNDGLDDVATWCREKVTAVEPPTRVHAITDATLLFTAKDGHPELLQIKESAPAALLHQRICSNQPRTPPCNSTEAERHPENTK